MDFDKASGNYQLHLILSREQPAEEDDYALAPNSLLRICNQPKLNNGPLNYVAPVKRKGKAKIKQEIKTVSHRLTASVAF